MSLSNSYSSHLIAHNFVRQLDKISDRPVSVSPLPSSVLPFDSSRVQCYSVSKNGNPFHRLSPLTTPSQVFHEESTQPVRSSPPQHYLHRLHFPGTLSYNGLQAKVTSLRLISLPSRLPSSTHCTVPFICTPLILYPWLPSLPRVSSFTHVDHVVVHNHYVLFLLFIAFSLFTGCSQS